MIRYSLGRLIGLIGSVLVISLILFLATRWLPGTPWNEAEIPLQGAAKENMMRKYGLDKPATYRAWRADILDTKFALLELLLTQGYRPVLSIPIVDEQGFAINSENDDIVNTLQEVLHADRIVQLIEAPGFLNNRDDPDSVVDLMTRSELQQREQQVDGRMKRKMLALRRLFDAGAGEVVIADGRVEHPVRDALAGRGTIIR